MSISHAFKLTPFYLSGQTLPEGKGMLCMLCNIMKKKKKKFSILYDFRCKLIRHSNFMIFHWSEYIYWICFSNLFLIVMKLILVYFNWLRWIEERLRLGLSLVWRMFNLVGVHCKLFHFKGKIKELFYTSSPHPPLSPFYNKKIEGKMCRRAL